MSTTSAAPDLATLRTDLVGSFLRPEALKTATAQFAAGAFDADALRRLQDESIRALVAEQERHGLPIVNDGEYRRGHFMESFADVRGTEPWRAVLRTSTAYQRVGGATEVLGQEHGNEVRAPVTQRLVLERNVPLEEYRFVAGIASRPATVTIIGPDRIGQRYAYEESRAFYPGGLDEFLADVVRVEREMIGGLREGGCRYVHMDAPGFTAYVDENTLAAMRARGEDPDANLTRSIAAENGVVRDHPGMTFGIHLCRGNSRSQWHRQGSYDRVAEQLFGTLAHQRYLLEYDDERSGGFEPLRFVPKGKVVVLGLITTKRGTLEPRDELIRRIEEAARFVPIEQLALSPQCGFSSGIAGNVITMEEQWRKIDLMLDVAREVWGTV